MRLLIDSEAIQKLLNELIRKGEMKIVYSI